MKIIKVTKSTTYYVETDEKYYPDFQTSEEGDHWLRAYGESWEPEYHDEEIKRLFKEYRNSKEIS
jgi:hypothetical protein